MIRDLFGLETRLRPYSIRSLKCPLCKVESGEDCLTATGEVAAATHRRRVKAFLDKSKVLLVEVTRGDGHVKRGERYWAQPYSLDAGKLTLLQRVDGWDPERNEYTSNCKTLGWLCPSEYKDWHD